MSHRRKTRRRRKHPPRQQPLRRPADPAPPGWKVLSIAGAAIIVDGAWALWIIREYRIYRHLHFNPISFTICIFLTAWAIWQGWLYFRHNQ